MDNEVIAKHNRIINLTLLLLSIFITCIVCEITLRLFDKIENYAGYRNAAVRTVSGTAYQRDSHIWGPPLGYSPKPNQVLSAKITYDNGDIIFDRKYSIDQYGNRLTVNRFQNEQRETIIYYGCSMTFGEGLRDEDTLPSQFAKALNYKSHIVNMAYNGYGVHHMLRSLELDLPKKNIVGRVRYVIYGAIHSAASRALNPTCYLGFTHGPKYILDKVGVKYNGEYSTKGIFNFFMYRLKPSLSARSRLFQRISRAFEINSTENIAFYIAMLQRARGLIKDRYGAEFIIFFHDEEMDDLSEKLEKQFIENNFRYIKRSSIIPLKDSKKNQYAIAGDGHPTADANKEYANYLATYIIAHDLSRMNF